MRVRSANAASLPNVLKLLISHGANVNAKSDEVSGAYYDSLHGCFNTSAGLMYCLKALYTALYRAWSMHTTVAILRICSACFLEIIQPSSTDLQLHSRKCLIGKTSACRVRHLFAMLWQPMRQSLQCTL